MGVRADMGQLGIFSRHSTAVVATVGLSDRLFLLAFHFPPPHARPAPPWPWSHGQAPRPTRHFAILWEDVDRHRQ
jgi:hypothetical protein